MRTIPGREGCNRSRQSSLNRVLEPHTLFHEPRIVVSRLMAKETGDGARGQGAPVSEGWDMSPDASPGRWGSAVALAEPQVEDREKALQQPDDGTTCGAAGLRRRAASGVRG